MTVSVVIPLYNKVRTIRRAIDSALAQTYADFELIVVDDGSTDDGGKIVQSYADSRIRLVSQPNAGVSAARNRGVAEARSELMAFLDADDEWRPTFLEAATDALNRFPEAVAAFTNYLLTTTMAPALPCDENAPPILIDDYFRFYLEHGDGMWPSCSVVRREALLEAGRFPVGRKMGEDLDTWFRLACVGKIAFVPKMLATYHVGIGACAVECGNPDVWDSYQSWRKAGKIPGPFLSSAAQWAVGSRLHAVLYSLRAGKRLEARRLLSALRWGDLLNPMGIAGCVACYLPLMPRTLQWGIIRFAQKYFT